MPTEESPAKSTNDVLVQLYWKGKIDGPNKTT